MIDVEQYLRVQEEFIPRNHPIQSHPAQLEERVAQMWQHFQQQQHQQQQPREHLPSHTPVYNLEPHLAPPTTTPQTQFPCYPPTPTFPHIPFSTTLLTPSRPHDTPISYLLSWSPPFPSHYPTIRPSLLSHSATPLYLPLLIQPTLRTHIYTLCSTLPPSHSSPHMLLRCHRLPAVRRPI